MPKISSIKILQRGPLAGCGVSGIPESARLVVLLGPNGCGKSSLLEALHTYERSVRGPHAIPGQRFEHLQVQIGFHGVTAQLPKPLPLRLYNRSAYRAEHHVSISRETTFQLLNHKKEDRQPFSLNHHDKRVEQNLRHLLRAGMQAIRTRATWEETLAELVVPISDRLKRIFPHLELLAIPDSLVDPNISSAATFCFSNGGRDYTFAELSAGEREVFDLLLDLYIWGPEFQDALFCIDEPELHLHTELQSKLIRELFSTIPESGQLWIATHSIGIIRTAMDLHKSDPASVIFLNLTNFKDSKELVPSRVDRSLWKSAFSVALHDLADLIVPQEIVICEGKPLGAGARERAEFDSQVYRTIFHSTRPATEFLSSGSCNEVLGDSLKLAASLSYLTPGLRIISLVDRDDRNDTEIVREQRRGFSVLRRRSIENYLWSDEILTRLCDRVGKAELADAVLDWKASSLGKTQGEREHPSDNMKDHLSSFFNELKKILPLRLMGNNYESFARDNLAALITPDTATFKALEKEIFHNEP